MKLSGNAHALRLAAALCLMPFSVSSGEAAAGQPRPGGMLDIRDFGAVADGVTVSTAAIQAAIDACSEQRAAGVVVAGGSYVTGTVFLKDYVTLHVAAGAELLGSTDIADYPTGTHKNMYKNEPHMDRCLIFARGVKHIGIEGAGVIDGRGHRENFPNKSDPQKNRPMMIRLIDCETIRMRDITLRNPAAWTSAWLYCSDIVVDGITIHSRANGNGDGLDFDGCQDVRVSNCSFDTSDDSICLQNSKPGSVCRDVVIDNCTFTSKWAGIRIGLLSRGDFNRVTVTNCIFRDIQDSGLKIQMCEGGEMKRMLFANLVMENVPRPVFMTFGQQRAADDAPPGVAPMNAMGDMVFRNFLVDTTACGKDSAFIFVGMPGHPIENITLEGIRFHAGGGGTVEDAANKIMPDLTVERLEGWWPEYVRFGQTVPCFGVYASHVKGLTVRNAEISTAALDERPAMVCDDVEDLDLCDVKVHASASSEPIAYLHNVRGESVKDLRAVGPGHDRKLVLRN